MICVYSATERGTSSSRQISEIHVKLFSVKATLKFSIKAQWILANSIISKAEAAEPKHVWKPSKSSTAIDVHFARAEGYGS